MLIAMHRSFSPEGSNRIVENSFTNFLQSQYFEHHDVGLTRHRRPLQPENDARCRISGLLLQGRRSTDHGKTCLR
ncbi:protein of unknown function (plasmid) [Caballeronia sp. S22]